MANGNRQKGMFRRRPCCAICSAEYDRGDVRLITITPYVYSKDAPERSLNPGVGVRVDKDCMALALAFPNGDQHRKLQSLLSESLMGIYKSITTLPDTPGNAICTAFGIQTFPELN